MLLHVQHIIQIALHALFTNNTAVIADMFESAAEY